METMTIQWEYLRADLQLGDDDVEKLNFLGADGWELVSTWAPLGGWYVAWLKRPTNFN